MIWFVVIAMSCTGQNNATLAPEKFANAIARADAQILDVRTFEEYKRGHIKNSLQADWYNNSQFHDRIQHLDKNKPVFIYCGSGVRSREAAKKLRKQGFEQVFELERGILSWNKNNLPLDADVTVKQMNQAEYDSLRQSAPVVLVDFGAKWCPPCKKMEPVLEQLEKDLPKRYSLVKIDAGVHTNIMNKVAVQALPTFIVYKNGLEIWRKEGLVTLEEFKKHLQ